MPTIPVFIYQSSSEETETEVPFEAHPLFLERPVIYGSSVDRIGQEMRSTLRRFVISNDEATHPINFWLHFAPELRPVPLTVSDPRKPTEKITLPAWQFTLSGGSFVRVPTLGKKGWFRLEEAHDSERSLVRQVEELFRKWHFEERSMPEVSVLGNFGFTQLIRVEMNLPDSQPVKRSPFGAESGQEEEILEGQKDLYQIGMNLSDRYPEFLRTAHLRESLVRELHAGLFGPEPQGYVLIGRPGTGRHTLLEHALRLELDRNTSPRAEAWSLDPNRIVAGMSVIGAWERRFAQLLAYLSEQSSKNRRLLVFDQPRTLLTAASDTVTMAHFLIPYLQENRLRIVLIATPESWQYFQERLPELSGFFRILRCREPDHRTGVQMALLRRNELERQHRVRLRAPVVTEVHRLHRLFTPHRALPGALTRAFEALSENSKTQPSPEDCRIYFREQTGLSGRLVRTDTDVENEPIEQYLSRQIVGQEEAIRTLADAYYLSRARLLRPGRPVASFLLLGSTGVGKTESARALTEYLTGSSDNLVRINMNEFTSPYQVQQLIGTPLHPGGILTDAVKSRPSGVLLLDEIEKAHPSIYHLLLQVLDAARLTDVRGQTVRFNDYLIIMTSNLGAEQVDQLLTLRDDEAERRAVYRKAVLERMPPEFVNRIDRIVFFNRLQPEHLIHIARLQIDRLLNREGFLRRTTLLKVSDAALHWVATRGYDPKMGGRALKRQIERDLTVVSAEKLSGLHAGQPVVLVLDLLNDALDVRMIPLDPVPTQIPAGLDRSIHTRNFRREINLLVQRAETIRDRVNAHLDQLGIDLTDPEQQQHSWLYFHFRDRVLNVVDGMRRVHLRSQQELQRQVTGVPSLRVRRIPLQQRAKSSKKTIQIRDLLFLREIREEILQKLTLTEPDFSSLHSLYLHHYIRLKLLERSLPGFLADRAEQVDLCVEVETSVSGRDYPQKLLRQYRETLQSIGVYVEEVEGKTQMIRVQGFGIQTLLRGETGIHLFQPDQGSAVPVRVYFRQTAPAGQPDYRLIRSYFSDRFVIDPRTELRLTFPTDPDALLLLIWAGAQ